MKTKFIISVLIFAMSTAGFAQNQIVYPQGGVIGGLTYTAAKEIMPEYGFLPGKKFPTYPTIKSFDFKGLKLKVILYNDREVKKLDKVNCSEIKITNASELKEIREQ